MLIGRQGADLYHSPAQLLPPKSEPAPSGAMDSVPAADMDIPSTVISPQENKNQKDLCQLGTEIYNLLESNSLSMEQLASHFTDKLPAFPEVFSVMEPDGIVERLPGGKIKLSDVHRDG